MLGMNYGPDHDPLAILEHRERGAISVYAQGEDYHEVIKPRLKDAGALADCAGRRRREGVRRHRRRDGEAARRGRRHRLAGQAHQSRVARNSARGCFSARSSPRSNCRPTSRRPTTAAPAGPASTSARPRRFPRPTGSMRGAAFPISPSSTKGRSRANCAPRSATASTAATIASRSARGTSSRRQGREAKLAAREARARPTLSELVALDDAAFRAMFAKTAVKRTGRDRFIRNVLIAIGNSGDPALVAASRAAARRRLAARSRRRGLGARPARSGAARRAGAVDARARADAGVAEEWAAAPARFHARPC